MTCEYIYDKDGKVLAIACSRGAKKPSVMGELKKAMACRRWETCDRCELYTDCQRKFKEVKL